MSTRARQIIGTRRIEGCRHRQQRGRQIHARAAIEFGNAVYRHVEIDGLLWQAGWELSAVEYYNSEHARLIAEESWIIDGLGRQESIPERLARSTDIFLVDMPLWIHFWFAAERQIRCVEGTLEHPPAGLTKMPPTEGLFRTIWEVDRDWMPEIRRLVTVEEQQGKRIVRLGSVADLNKFAGSS